MPSSPTRVTPPIPPVPRLRGGTPYYMPLLKENHWLPDLKAIPAGVLAKTKLMWLNYPNNPTGATGAALVLRRGCGVLQAAQHFAVPR